MQLIVFSIVRMLQSLGLHCLLSSYNGLRSQKMQQVMGTALQYALAILRRLDENLS